MDILPDFQKNTQFTFGEALGFIQHKDGRPVYKSEESLCFALSIASRLSGDKFLRAEFSNFCKQGLIPKSFLERVFHCIPASEKKQLVFPDSAVPLEKLPEIDAEDQDTQLGLL